MNNKRRRKLQEAEKLIAEAKKIIESVKNEEAESLHWLPNSFQVSKRGDQMADNVSLLDATIKDLVSAECYISTATFYHEY